MASPSTAVEYIQAETPVSSTAHPVKGPFDHSFSSAPDRPDTFLGPWADHVKANFRSFYYDQEKENGDENAAWVAGGSVGYHTGKWNNMLGFGGTVYTSQKLWGPDSKDGTGLLKPGQQSFTVLGEAYAELEFKGLTAIAGRREMNLPFINREDIRQVPITHESYVIGRRGTDLDFVLGHVARQKNRDDDEFRSMARINGIRNKNKGVSVAGFHAELPHNLRFGTMTQYGWDMYNTSYTDLLWDHRNQAGWNYHLGAQFTDQRSVGDELLGNYDAQSWGLRGAIGQGGQSLKLTYTENSDDGQVRRDYGGTPSFSSMFIEKFDKAGERAIGVQYSSHFADFGLPEWAATVHVVNGTDNVDADTGAELPDEIEVNFNVDFKPQGKLKGLWVRLRYIYVDFDSGGGHRWNTRIIINYKIPVSTSM